MGLLCFLIYNANLRVIGGGDSVPARYLPLILWQSGTLKLDGHACLVAHGHSMVNERNRPGTVESKVQYFAPWAYWMVRTRQHELASLYPVVTPLLVAPLYLPAVLWLNTHGWEQPHVDRVAEVMEKLSAAFLASIASVLMFLVLRRDNSRWSLALAVAFAFGTNTWMISSQALWQHGAGELLIALALLLVLVRATPLRTTLLGAVCVLIAANRPPDALVAGGIVLYAVWSHWRSAVWMFAGAFVPLVALLYYNLDFIGHYAGGYALATGPNTKFFQLGWSGLAGLLVSPTRGLLVFSPFLIFVPVGLFQRLRAPESRGLAMALSFAVAAQLLVYSQADWRAGSSWGPRWLTDILPILVWMAAPAPLVLGAFARGLFVMAMVASVGVQVIGAFWYARASDAIIFAAKPSSMAAAWDFKNVPFLVELRHSRVRGDLHHDATGGIDRVGTTLLTGTGAVPRLETGDVIEGWALAGGRAPAQLLVLIDGIVIGKTHEFVPRAHVGEKTQTDAPLGWRVSANLRGVPTGERVLQLALGVDATSDIRIVREQRVFVVAAEIPQSTPALSQDAASASELEGMAARARALLQERQNDGGFWLTAHTKGLRYEAPQQEMNTFLTSTLVDLLLPIARAQSLDEVLERARRHLAAQIESDGLVRYHGLPDGPAIGTLGCVITPDADDTALVWKVAGPGKADPRLPRMLEKLAEYRDVRGFYRTWLAPRKEYRNLDPGRDPNPTDFVIQANVYLMLRELDWPAAQKLQHALERHIGDEDLWVYYTKAPLLPYLRAAELQKLGFTIPLPGERLMLPVGGQEIWSEAADCFVKMIASPVDANLRQAVQHLLVRLGRDDFAAIRHAPPLLYHNDLSATVKRFYWSEDFGYALWLRLYESVRVEPGLNPSASP